MSTKFVAETIIVTACVAYRRYRAIDGGTNFLRIGLTRKIIKCL